MISLCSPPRAFTSPPGLFFLPLFSHSLLFLPPQFPLPVPLLSLSRFISQTPAPPLLTSQLGAAWPELLCSPSSAQTTQTAGEWS